MDEEGNVLTGQDEVNSLKQRCWRWTEIVLERYVPDIPSGGESEKALTISQRGQNRRTIPRTIRAVAGNSQSTGSFVCNPGLVFARDRSLWIPAETRSH